MDKILLSNSNTRGLFIWAIGAVLVLAGQPVRAQYCTPSSSLCSEYIDDVTVGTINNTNTGGCNGGYSSYTAQSTSMAQGGAYPITVFVGAWYPADAISVWIDWNQDLTFDNSAGSSELYALSGTAPPGFFDGVIAVPPTATLGATRMRIRLTDVSADPVQPCGANVWGEAEDYTVNVTASTCTADYTGTAPFTQTQNTNGATQSCTYSTAGDHVWAVTISCAGTWTFSTCSANTLYDTELHLGSGCCQNNLATNDNSCGTSSQISVFLNPGTYYLTVEGSGAATGQYQLSVTGGPATCYCTAWATSFWTDFIKIVDVGSIYNVSGWSSYSDYTAQSTTMNIGNSYPMTVTKGYTYVNIDLAVWIDWNQNMVFDATEEIPVSNSPSAGPYNITVVPPVTAVLGPTRMRLRLVTNAATSPCGGQGWEVEDYTVVVAPACAVDFTVSAPYNSSTVVLPPGSATCGYSGGSDHVYAVDITCAGDYTFSLCNATTNFNTEMWVGTSCCNSSLGYNDDGPGSCGTASQITINGLAPGTYYVTISGVGGATGNYALSITPASLCYCAAAGLGGPTWIDDVIVGSINNTSTGNTWPYYHNYTAMSTNMLVGQSYTMTVDDNPFTNYVDVRLDAWVDWNANGVFDPSELLASSPAPAPFTVPITPPAGTAMGLKRMRLRLAWIGDPVNPCGSVGFEVEDYTINVTGPPNDECTGATGPYTLPVGAPCTSPSNQTSANATNSGVTVAGGACSGTNPDDDVWYSFVATNASQTITVSGSAGYDAVVELFSGTCSGLTSLQCVNATGAGGYENLTETGLTVGNTYYFRVYHAGLGSGTSTFTVCVSEPPANDASCSATSLTVSTCGGTPVGGSTTAATASGFVATCGGSPDDDVWYSFTATATSHIIQVAGSTGFDAVIELMTNVCALPVNMACANSTGTGQLEALNASGLTVGTTYLIRVYHAGTSWGTGNFTILVGSGTYYVGTGTSFNLSSTYPAAYSDFDYDSRQQYLVKASELQASGASAGQIQSIAFDVVATNGISALQNFTIKIKSTNKTAITEFDNYEFTNVFSTGSLTVTTGWNTHTFSTPFYWDGTSNIIVETCYNDPGDGPSTNASTRYSSAGFNAVVRSNTTTAPLEIQGDVCNYSYVADVSQDRPNMRFQVCPVPGSNIDAEMIRIDAPVPFVANGSSQTVTVVWRNNPRTSGNITSANLQYRWNGGAWVTQAWSGTLAPGQSTSFTFTTPFTATPLGYWLLEARVQNPNGVGSDNVTSNDLVALRMHVKDMAYTAGPVTWSGTDFWWTMPMNNSGNGPDNIYYLDLLSPFCATVTIEMPVLNYSTTVSLTPNVPTTFQMPLTVSGQPLYHTSTFGVQGKGIHITSDSAISVYAILFEQATVDGEAIMPTSSLGTSYVAQMRAPGYYDGGPITAPTYVTIVATEDNTTFRIHSWSGTTPVTYGSGITLMKGQTYRMSHSAVNCHMENTTGWRINCNTLSGATVMASKPIVCVGHVLCTNMEPCGACDVLMTQHVPYESWGTEYITAQAIDRGQPDPSTCILGTVIPGVDNTADMLEIVGPVGTQVTIQNLAGSQTLTIPPPPYPNISTWRQHHGFGYIWYENQSFGTPIHPEFHGEANTRITANNPIEVTQYGKGYQYDVSDRGPNTDPEAITIFPTSSWNSAYIVSTLNTLTSSITAIVIVAPTAQISNFQMSGPNNCVMSPIPPIGWQSFASGYSFLRIPITPAAYRLVNTASVPFGVYLDAVGQAESYIVQAGFDLDAVPTNLQDCHTCALLEVDGVVLDGRTFPEFHHLEWVSVNEVTNDRYVLERSIDGKDFAEVAAVEAIGSSTAETTYEFDDFMRADGASYYRVRVVHLDGSLEYTNIVRLDYSPSQLGISIEPNPASENATVTFDAYNFNGGMIEVSVRSSFGQVVWQSQVQLPQHGIRSLNLNVMDLASGVYYVNVRNQQVDITNKLVVTH